MDIALFPHMRSIVNNASIGLLFEVIPGIDSKKNSHFYVESFSLALRRRKSLIKSLKESQVEIVYKQSVSFLNSIKSLPPDPRAKLIVRFPTLFFTFFTPYLPFPCSFGFLSFQILLIFILDSFYNNCISKFKGQG